MIPDSKFYHSEVFAGIEKPFRIKQQLFKFGFYGVTAANTVDKLQFTWKFGINFFNTFTKKWEY